MTTAADLGQVIRDFREEHEMTQTQLAQRLGISARALGNYENGRRWLPTSTIVAMADAWRTDYDIGALHELVTDFLIWPSNSESETHPHDDQ